MLKETAWASGRKRVADAAGTMVADQVPAAEAGGGGNVGGRTHGGRPRPVHRRYDSDNGPGPYPDQEPTENGEPGPLEPGGGVLELHPNGYGFLRNPDNNLQRERTDPFVPGTMIEKFRLREGVTATAWSKQAAGSKARG